MNYYGLASNSIFFIAWDSKMRWNNLLGDLAVNVTAGSRAEKSKTRDRSDARYGRMEPLIRKVMFPY
jgi:hypothetical protein